MASWSNSGPRQSNRAFFERMAAAEPQPTADAIKALLAGTSGGEALMPLTTRNDYNAQIPHDLRRHAPRSRPRRECAAADRPRYGELPRAAGRKVEDVGRTLARVIGDEKVKISSKGKAILSPPSPINPRSCGPVEALAAEMWPGVPVIPTHGRRLHRQPLAAQCRHPGPMASPACSPIPAPAARTGSTSKVGVKDSTAARSLLYRLVKRLAAPGQQRRDEVTAAVPAQK